MAKTGETWNFTYNTDGLRTSRSNGTTTYNYVYNNGQLRKMTVNGQPIILRYGADGKPYSLRYAGVDYLYILNAQGDVIGIANTSGTQVVTYNYDAWGDILSVTGSMASTLGQMNPLRYRGYVYDTETQLYYLQSRYYNPEMGRFINADNNLSNLNLYVYCGNNPISRGDANGEHWYYFWIDDLFEKADELLTCVSDTVFGGASLALSFFNPAAAQRIWQSRPFQDNKPSQEMRIFTDFMYKHDFVMDFSVSAGIPKSDMYVKAGFSQVLSPRKNINASYVHVGGGVSTPSALPINVSYSLGTVNGVNVKEDYAKDFLDIGAGSVLGFDYCCWPNGASAYSFTVGTSYGIYGGYDYYWCIN